MPRDAMAQRSAGTHGVGRRMGKGFLWMSGRTLVPPGVVNRAEQALITQDLWDTRLFTRAWKQHNEAGTEFA